MRRMPPPGSCGSAGGQQSSMAFARAELDYVHGHCFTLGNLLWMDLVMFHVKHGRILV